MKFKYLLFCLLPLCGLASCNKGKTTSNGIEFVFDTTSRKTGISTVAFNLIPSVKFIVSPEDFRAYVDWGDGKNSTITMNDYEDEDGAFTHSYDKPNKYKIKIGGDISGFSFSDLDGEMLSDDNINTDNFVLNSIEKSGISECTIALGGVNSAGVVSKMSDVKINYPLSFLYEDMFADTSLKTVTLPSSLLRIKDSDFAELDTLETVNLPKDSSLTVIEDEAFKGCSALKSFTVPKYVIQLGSGVFSGCTSLTEFVFPSTVEKIGTDPVQEGPEGPDTFEGCTKLKTLKFEGIFPPEIRPNITFKDLVPEKVIVPKGCVERYKTKWKDGVPEVFLSKIVEA